MVGGGPGGFIGAVHRIAARLDDHFELVAGGAVFRSGRAPAPPRWIFTSLPIGPTADFAEMAAAEAKTKRPHRRGRHRDAEPSALRAGEGISRSRHSRHLRQAAHHHSGRRRATWPQTCAARLLSRVTHNYTGYPTGTAGSRRWSRRANWAPIRVVQVEYAQDWLATPLEQTGQKQAAWRTDPAQAGPRVAGRHRHPRLQSRQLCHRPQLQRAGGRSHTFVPGRRLDDNVQIMLRFAEGARGCSGRARWRPETRTNLRLRVYGEKGGHRMAAGESQLPVVCAAGQAPTLIYRSGRVDSGGGARQSHPGGESRGIS